MSFRFVLRYRLRGSLYLGFGLLSDSLSLLCGASPRSANRLFGTGLVGSP